MIIYRWFGYHYEARTWHHSAGSLLAGNGSHSTDQLGGKVPGQVKPAIISSKDAPKNSATSKAEYTNTQQGLPNYWYVNNRLLSMHGSKALGFYFAEKQQRVSL
jgi:hypothetical protein